MKKRGLVRQSDTNYIWQVPKFLAQRVGGCVGVGRCPDKPCFRKTGLVLYAAHRPLMRFFLIKSVARFASVQIVSQVALASLASK